MQTARDWNLPSRSTVFNRFVGIEFVELHADGATMRLDLGDEHRDAKGIAHGGVVFTLADSAIGTGIYKVLGKPCTTAEMKINYLRPVTGDVLTARSYILTAGTPLVVARAEVHSGAEHVAEVLSTFAVLGRA